MNEKEAEEIKDISKNHDKYAILLVAALIFIILALIIYGVVVY